MNDIFTKPAIGFVFTDVEPELLRENHDLGFGWVLRKATAEELNNQQIRFMLKRHAQLRGHDHGYPANLQDVKRLSEVGVANAQPDSEDHLHQVAGLAVVETKGNPHINPILLKKALSIADAEIKIGVFMHPDEKSYSMDSFNFSGFRTDVSRMRDLELCLKRPSVSDLPDLRETIAYMAGKNVTEQIHTAIHLFLSLDSLPDGVPMKSLGYFTTIESLLSHSPTSNDRADSIQRQLKRNLILVDHRLRHVGRGLGFENFADMNPETLISKLYSYRSAIAHGGNHSSELEKLEKLVTDHTPWPKHFETEWIEHWLRRLVRRVLFAAIREPQLITDLK